MAARGLKLLFDENFSRRQVEFVAKESRLAEMQHVSSRGWSGMRDIDWIPLAVKAEFRLITGDRNDRTRGFTVADLKSLGAQVLLVGSFFDHLSRWEKAKWLVGELEGLIEIANQLAPGSVMLVDRRGRAKNV